MLYTSFMDYNTARRLRHVQQLYAADMSINSFFALQVPVDGGGVSAAIIKANVVRPEDTDTLLGNATVRWSQLYASTATINTSDQRLKDTITSVPDNVLDAWSEVDFVQYQMKDALQKKGSAARFHSGLIAQSIDQAFSKHNLDASRYGLFCYDEWKAEPAEYDENGGRIREAQPAGNQYSLRYEEALCMEAAYQRRQNSRTESRFLDLEQRIALLEEKIKQEEK